MADTSCSISLSASSGLRDERIRVCSRWLRECLEAGQLSLQADSVELQDQLLLLPGISSAAELQQLLSDGCLLQLLLQQLNLQPLQDWQLADSEARRQHFLELCRREANSSEDADLIQCVIQLKLHTQSKEPKLELNENGETTNLLQESGRQLQFLQSVVALRDALNVKVMSLWQKSDVSRVFGTIDRLFELHSDLHKQLRSCCSSSETDKAIINFQQRLMHTYCIHTLHIQLHALPYLKDLVTSEQLCAQAAVAIQRLHQQLQPALCVDDLLQLPMQHCGHLSAAAAQDRSTVGAEVLQVAHRYLQEFLVSLPAFIESRKAFERISGRPQWLKFEDIGCLRKQGTLTVENKKRHCILWDTCLIVTDSCNGQYKQIVLIGDTAPPPEPLQSTNRKSWPLEFEKTLLQAESKESQEEWIAAMSMAKSLQWPFSTEQRGLHRFKLHTVALNLLPAKCDSCGKWLEGCEYQAMRCISCGSLRHLTCLPSLLEPCPGPDSSSNGAMDLTRSSSVRSAAPRPVPRMRRPSVQVESSLKRRDTCDYLCMRDVYVCKEAGEGEGVVSNEANVWYRSESLDAASAPDAIAELQQQHHELNFCIAKSDNSRCSRSSKSSSIGSSSSSSSSSSDYTLFVLADELLNFPINATICNNEYGTSLRFHLQSNPQTSFTDLNRLVQHYAENVLPSYDGNTGNGVMLSL